MQGNIPSIGLAATATLAAVENKIPNVTILFKKTDFDAKILDTEKKYFATSYYNKFTRDILDVKIEKKGLVHKSALPGFISNADLKKKTATLATKA